MECGKIDPMLRNYELAQELKAKGISPDACSRFHRVHKCNSFFPMPGAPMHVCQNCTHCEPIHSSLKQECLVSYCEMIVCPYPAENLNYLLYWRNKEVKEKDGTKND